MYTYALVYGVAFLVFFFLCISVGVLLGWKRGFFPSLLRLGLVIFSFLFALPVSGWLSPLFSDALKNRLIAAIGQSNWEEIVKNSPATEQVAEILPVALLTPLLFILVFLLFKGLTWLLFSFIKNHLPGKPLYIFRIFGCVAGAVGSAILFLAITFPILGTAGTLHAAAIEMEKTNPATLSTTFRGIYNTAVTWDQKLFGSLIENTTAQALTHEGDNALYKTLSSATWEDKDFIVKTELTHLAALTMHVGQIKTDLTEYTETDTARIRTVAEDIKADPLLTRLGTEWASALMQAWSEGKSYAGIDVPHVSSFVSPFLEETYAILATTTEETLDSDIVALSYILDALAESGVLNVTENAATVVKSVVSGKLVNDLETVCHTYPRFQPLMDNLDELLLKSLLSMFIVNK